MRSHKIFIYLRDFALEVSTISLELFKLMIPILLLVKIIQTFGGTVYIAKLIMPAMAFIGLPPELGIVWAGAMLSNIYTGMVLFVSNPDLPALSVSQVTTLGLLLLFAHSLPVELRVAQKIGVSIGFSFVFRLLTAYGAAGLYFHCMAWFKPESPPAKLLWQPLIEQESLGLWLISQTRMLGQIVLIIAILLIVLRIIRKLKFDKIIHYLLRPVLPLLGLSHKAVDVVLVGMTLGLTYGGGLMIQESRRGRLTASELFFSVCLLLICHGLIEDTLLILLLGADLFGILGFRVALSFLIVAVLVAVLKNHSDKVITPYFLNNNFRQHRKTSTG